MSPTSASPIPVATAPAPTQPTSPPPAPPPPLEAVLVGAGDIAECGQPGAARTAALLDGLAGTVFTAGDNAYMNGSAREFECYDATWGRHRHRTFPATGNHDYGTPDASGYFQYFGERAGPMGQGYYGFDAGAWRVVSLNSNVGWREGSAQLQWLRRDLQQASGRCIAAIMHHPLVSSGPNGDNPHVRDLWRALVEAGADVVVASHDHLYERHARMNPDGRPDSRGARLFTVGTGGARTYPVGGAAPTTEAKVAVWGVVRFVLQPASYRWEFVSVEGVLDSGLDTCADRGIAATVDLGAVPGGSGHRPDHNPSASRPIREVGPGTQEASCRLASPSALRCCSSLSGTRTSRHKRVSHPMR